MDIYLATSNSHKIEEIKSCIDSYYLESNIKKNSFSINFYPASDIVDSFDCKEDGISFEENALIKARYLKSKLKGKLVSVLADDSGLEVKALNNEPGIYSARYSVSGTDYDNNQKLLENMKDIKDRRARFRCVLAYINEKNEEYIFKGDCKGSILTELRGNKGFGYDPLFLVDNLNKTYAMLTQKEKDDISHRGVAIRKWLDFLVRK